MEGDEERGRERKIDEERKITGEERGLLDGPGRGGGGGCRLWNETVQLYVCSLALF